MPMTDPTQQQAHEELRAAQALLSVLDENIKRLRRAPKFDEIPSERQAFIYSFEPIDVDVSNVQLPYSVTRQMVLDPDAAFVARAVLMSVPFLTLTSATRNWTRLSIVDVQTGRDLMWGQTSDKDTLSAVPTALFPVAGSKTGSYLWFELPAEYLLPKAAVLRLQLTTATIEGSDSSVTDLSATVALLGYKKYAD